jgi:hypothetical protein
MTTTIATTSWGKGELSPQVRGHVDTTHYYSSAKSLNNMIVRPYAIPVRRAGTKYVAEVKDSDEDVRLIEFVFSVDQSYIIEMGKFYFIPRDSDGNRLTLDLDAINTWADATKYVDGDLVAQNNDATAWETGRKYHVGEYVTNIGNTYVCLVYDLFGEHEPGVDSGWETFWELVVAVYAYFVCTSDHASSNNNRPGASTNWRDYWDEMTLASGQTGIWNVEIAHPYTEQQIWDVDYAQKNDVIKLTHNLHDIAELRRFDNNVWSIKTAGLIEGAPWETLNEDITLKMRSNGADVGVGKSIQSQSDFPAFTQSDEDERRSFRIGPLNDKGEQGYFTCTNFVDSTHLEGENIVKIGSTSFTSAWARNAFYADSVTGERNYPAHVTFYEGRLVLANTPNDPSKLWFSKSFIYNDFNVGDTVAFGFDLEANTAQANKIEWIASSSSLATGTFGAEFNSESSSDTGFNNDTKNIREQSSWGSKFVKPVKVGSRLYFVQRTGRKLREYVYSFDVNSFQSVDMTEYSDHVTLSGIVDMHYQRNQDSLNWCVLENGKMAILSRQPEQDIQAWTPWETDGEVKSIRFIPNPNGESDRGFIIVERVIDGSTVKYIEYFDNHVVEDDTLQTKLYYVDSGFCVDTFDDTDGIDLTINDDAVYIATKGNDLERTVNPTPYYIAETVGNDANVQIFPGNDRLTSTSPYFVVGDVGRTIDLINTSGDPEASANISGYFSSTIVFFLENAFSGYYENRIGGSWGFSTDTVVYGGEYLMTSDSAHFEVGDIGKTIIKIDTDGTELAVYTIMSYTSTTVVGVNLTSGTLGDTTITGGLWGLSTDTFLGQLSVTAESAFFDAGMTDKKIKIVDSGGVQLGLFSLDTYTSTTLMSGTWDTEALPDQTITGGLWGVSVLDITSPDYNTDALEGETVALFFDGIYEGTGVVTGGTITNATHFWIAAIGLPYTSTYQSNPLNANTPSGMAKGRIRRINEIALEFYKSIGMEYSSNGINWFPVGVPEGEDDTVFFTGTVPNLTFEGKLDYDGYLYLRQTKPYSMNLLGIYSQAEIARQ